LTNRWNLLKFKLSPLWKVWGSTSENPFHAVIVAYKLTISGGSYLKGKYSSLGGEALSIRTAVVAE
jgi:hypothetical protein